MRSSASRRSDVTSRFAASSAPVRTPITARSAERPLRLPEGACASPPKRTSRRSSPSTGARSALTGDGFLSRLPAFADRIAVLEAGGDAGEAGQPGDAAGLGIVAYATAWRNEPDSTVIGPVVAPHGAAARRLIAELAAHAPTPVRLDLDPDRPELPGWAHAHGLEPVGRNVVMAHGSLRPRGAPERLFAPISVALA